MRGAGSSRSRSSSAARAPTSSSPTPTSRRRPRRRRGRCSTTPGRTAARAAASWSSAACLDRFLELLEPAVKAFEVGDPPTRRPRWARSSRRRTATRVQPFLDGPDRGRLPRDRRPRVPGFWFAPDGAAPGIPQRPRRAPRRSSGRWSACCRSTTRPTRSRSPTTRSTGSPDRSGPTTSAARIRVARGVESGTLSVNSHSSVRYTTPFGGMKQCGLGRELGSGRRLAFTETKNVFFAS